MNNIVNKVSFYSVGRYQFLLPVYGITNSECIGVKLQGFVSLCVVKPKFLADVISGNYLESQFSGDCGLKPGTYHKGNCIPGFLKLLCLWH